jgi:hypothetical protein
MRYVALIFASLCLVRLDARADDAKTQKPIPDDCPVTLPTEPRYDPELPYGRETNIGSFWYGSDALFVWIRADGRWPRQQDRMLWFRKQRDWQADHPRPQLNVTAHRIDADGPLAIFLPVQSESPGVHAAVLQTAIKLPARGCWQISGNYKSDFLSFVVWVD